MSTTKKLSLLLVVVMIVSLFAGCGSSSSSSTADSGTEAETETASETSEAATSDTEAEEAAEDTEEVSEAASEEATEEGSETAAEETSEEATAEETAQSEEAEAADLTEEQQALLELIPEGDILTFVDLPLSETGETLSIYLGIHSTILTMYDDLSEVPFYRALEEATGVHLEFTAVSSMNDGTTLSLMVASDELTDIGSFGGALTQGMDGAIEDGTIIDLQDYFDVMPNYSALIENNDEFRTVVTTTGGHIPGASQYTFDNTAIYRTGLMARQDWIEELGIDTPETIEELENMLLMFKTQFGATAAYDIDSYGGVFTGETGMAFSNVYLSRAYGTDGGNFRLDEDGNVQSGWLLDGFKEYLMEMNTWYEEGLLASDFFTAESTMSDWTDVANGVNGVISAHASEMEEIKAVAADEDFELCAIVDPVLNEGDLLELENCFTEATPDGGYNVSASCSNPELACAWLDYLYSPNGWLLCNYGIEGESFEYDEDGQPHWTELITNPTDIPSGVAKSMYMIVQGPCLMYSPREFDAYTQNMIDASDVWASNIAETTYEYPNTITLLGEASEEYSAIISDIGTYISETAIRFITGDRNFEEDYDEFIDKLYAMNIERAIEIYQEAYDAFLANK